MPRDLTGGFAVDGLRELTRTFQHAPSDVRSAYRAELRTVGEPIRADAERLARSRIRRITPEWARMRVGVTQTLVYVAPRARGAKGRGGSRRPRFGTLLAQRATQPALRQNEHRIVGDFDAMLGRLAKKWNSEGKRTVP